MFKKNFQKWGAEKERLDTKDATSFPKVRDVRMCKVGINIGNEQNGGEDFSRPVLVIKKFNNTMFWVAPLSTKQKELDFYYNFTDGSGAPVSVILAQMRLVSVKRFERFLYKLDAEHFERIIAKLMLFLEGARKSKSRTRRDFSGSP